ncbi:hypothetical protein CGW93_02950 [candidate division bacterium WOR-3 4484_18]|uniref:DUF488 domain-containing protein n=1 Tax=candidate division WOR-3 bacterium 4484_18 TaxID=2020626 RepID=A0A257LUA0_UNCW3|nr:MAG: hypothetical protein CGW93_02950 [candidate division bacterium WOR-3 4484_18]
MLDPIYTIGYGNHKVGKFLYILKLHRIQAIVDVRSFPTSKNPDFKKENIARHLLHAGIQYYHISELGGYRKGGYEKYMETEAFKLGISKLLDIARSHRVAIMCLEPHPKYCHRRFISRYLEQLGHRVLHIT